MGLGSDFASAAASSIEYHFTVAVCEFSRIAGAASNNIRKSFFMIYRQLQLFKQLYSDCAKLVFQFDNQNYATKFTSHVFCRFYWNVFFIHLQTLLLTNSLTEDGKIKKDPC
jgi:hypothetical protein